MKMLNINDYRRSAKRALPKPIFGYIDGGADDEWSLENNISAFKKYGLMPEPLRDISKIDMSTHVLGCKLAAPLILSPTGTTRFAHHEKEIGVAQSAEQHGLMYTLSTLGTTSLEDIAKVKPGPKMFQIYIHKDRELTKELIARCKVAGYDALCLTVDTVIAGNRERDIRSGFVMPPRLTMQSFLSFAAHPVWAYYLWQHPEFELANITHSKETLSKGAISVISYVNSQFDKSLTWENIAWAIEEWGKPFTIKGLMSVADAKRAKEVGASAIMISNHGGRQLDTAPAPIDCVRAIRDAVGNDLELIVDGGIRRGTDLLKALALGANAVSFGRPYLYALAAGGQRGVDQMLTQFLDEVERGMGLLGRCRVDDVTEACLA